MTFTAAASKRIFDHRSTIHPYSPQADTWALLAWGQAAPSAAGWPLANLALFFPFEVLDTSIIYECFYATGTLTGGNLDIGLYDMTGARLTSTGTTARGTASSWITIGLTDYTISPGQYYAAMSADGTNNYVAWAPVAGACESMGMCEMTSAFVLPATATLARTTRAYVPIFGFNLRSLGT